MTAQYLVLAVLLAATLNHGNRFVRAAGTLLVAIGLAFIVLSIYLADMDGTFAALPAGNFRPGLLNAQAVAAVGAILFLLWAAARQWRRPRTAEVPWRNTGATYGRVSRAAHWATATLVLCLLPMGLFVQTLPSASPERAAFLAVHETLGETVLALVGCRIAWLAVSAPPLPSPSLRPWERFLARVVHPVLYALIILLPATGLPVTASSAGSPWTTLHDQVLPGLFCAVIALHLGAVLKHHFINRRVDAVRRMLR